MQKKITLPGEPQGKGRPRFGNGRAYTPAKTAAYESRLREAWTKQAKGFMFPDNAALSLEVKAFLQPPKSDSKARRAAKLQNMIRPTKKPDWDNIAKIVCDALNGTAYHDDAQIVFGAVGKFYSELPRIEVTITEVEPREEV